jgi:hypothetical protein
MWIIWPNKMSIFIPELFYFSTWVTADNGASGDLIEKNSSQINLFTQALAHAIFRMMNRFIKRQTALEAFAPRAG